MTPRAAGLFSLSGKVALVTGSTRSLGWSMARGLARAGAHVVINGREAAATKARTEELAGAGLKASAAPFDVTDAAAVAEAMRAIERDHGRLDILVNNAGIIHRKPLPDVADDDWQRIIDVDLTACFRLSRLAAAAMRRQGGGR
ncbi:MAG: gluconate 5-dehydrogenase, partial [Rhodospirillaceae bacterium]|nr:gluconate 5-dehydrogenase [Rhodospirillaceae bacterium]